MSKQPKNAFHPGEILIEELLEFCKDDDVLLTELISHLDNSKIKDDVNYVISKMRDDKINSILDERS